MNNFNNQVDEQYMHALCDNLAKCQMTLLSDKNDKTKGHNQAADLY